MPRTEPPQADASPLPSPNPKSTVCPYCGAASRNLTRCDHCRGPFDPLSRQATQNAMGPWFIRDDANPHRPGCSFDTLVQLAHRGKISPSTVIRGPTSLQFWTIARRCPGVANLLGICHNCQQPSRPSDVACDHCGASFAVDGDRQRLGLGEERFVPGREEAAASPSAAPVRSPVAVETAAEPEPDPGAPVHLERTLTKSRRWQVLWFVLAVVLGLALLAVLILPRLELEDGPLGAWLSRSEPTEPGDVLPPDLAPIGSGEKAPSSESAGSDSEPDADPDESLEPSAPVSPPEDAEGESEAGGAGPAADDRDERPPSLSVDPALERLRRLR